MVKIEKKLKITSQYNFASAKSFIIDPDNSQEEIELNLNDIRWNLKNSMFSRIEVEHVVESIDSLKNFMEELYRICELEGKIKIKTYYFNSAKQTILLNQKRQISEYTFLPFNRNWRVENKIQDQVNCNFEFTYGFDVGQEWSFRSEDTRNFAIKHYQNVVDELIVDLIKKN